jgi:hypothetical protein
MAELFDQLYQPACEAGIDAAAYWDMTYGEIVAAIKAHASRHKVELQQAAYLAYQQAHVITAMMSRVLGGKKSPPTIHQAFPGLFPQAERPQQQDWRLMKARMEVYADAKKKWGEKQHGHKTGGAAGPNHSQDSRAEAGSGGSQAQTGRNG